MTAGSNDETVLTSTALAGIGRRSAVEAVRIRIGRAVALGLLKPGERLPDQNEIALGLSVSPITARRAMTSLAEEGIVVRRRGRDGGTFVADEVPRAVLDRLKAPADESAAVHTLVDRRMLFECAITHYATLNATPAELTELDQLTKKMAAARDWSDYHRFDRQFHLLVARSAHMDGAHPVYEQALEELYEHFIPYEIALLRRANDDHVALVRALEQKDLIAAVDIARGHVATLHNSMFMGLSDGR
ncbi:FadR family transcriptional regulator [Antrihabitans sp. YC3-6]|uniref:FadR family transcriptional regulator n=1 Tax=Antrihabitans stalagmiti TaxID=2799499 RepID=A0A934NQG1_9NOCA|nr:FCD domain-containing protein [Antrihabitans stalagmiti]MBJ8339447.1 FadR family transcriptional regulator [Antrihabitans stalagmiti]